MKTRSGWAWVYFGAAMLVLGIILWATACDTGARKDLPQKQQEVTEGDAEVILMPDQFPNLVHRCIDTTGIWTTTADWVWIVYNDPKCGGEGDVLVLDNVPGSQKESG